jgi:hypothetical protein
VKIEPSSDIRQLAALLRQTFIALQDEGFTEKQAIAIIGEILASQMGGEPK